MQRKFQEIGVAVAGQRLGLFDGEVEFDNAGRVVCIEIFDQEGKNQIRLAIEDLFQERVKLRMAYGTDFLEMGGQQAQQHARKWYLFFGLSESLEDAFRDDIRDYVSEVRDASRFDAA
jgi:hypothetical protein